jgi:Rieske Fe-S protein
VTEVSQSCPDRAARPSRRSVLAGAGAIGAVGLLAACGTDSAASTSTPPPIPTEAGDPGASASPTTAGEPNVIKVTDIPVGGGKIYDEQRLVVTQPTPGTFKAFDSLCTHMGCVVTSVFAGKINCPCHQSQYSVVDGSVVGGPAPRPLSPKVVTITGDVIEVS